jgi:hypothetical protein
MDALKQELKRVCSAMRNAELSFEMRLIKTTQIKFRSKLEARDCEHFKAFGTRGLLRSYFANSGRKVVVSMHERKQPIDLPRFDLRNFHFF